MEERRVWAQFPRVSACAPAGCIDAFSSQAAQPRQEKVSGEVAPSCLRATEEVDSKLPKPRSRIMREPPILGTLGSRSSRREYIEDYSCAPICILLCLFLEFMLHEKKLMREIIYVSMRLGMISEPAKRGRVNIKICLFTEASLMPRKALESYSH